MFIENEVRLDFDDVLIRPKRSKLVSRKNVNLRRSFKLPHSPWLLECVPIIAANMDYVATPAMAKAFSEFDMLIAMNKFLTNDEIKECIEYRNSFFTLGIEPWDKLESKLESVISQFIDTDQTIKLCLDVANGYTEEFIKRVEKLRTYAPDAIIMAGNVATRDLTEQLIISGADIVKVGIGPGCFSAGTRVLMSNGFYKNIEEIVPGDRVINKDGNPVNVVRKIYKGRRGVVSLRHNKFYKPTFVTSDHNFYVGDLNTTSKKTIKSRGYVKLLEQNSKTTPKESKYKWKEISELKKDVLLLPNNINFEIPETFNVDLSNYFLNDKYAQYYNQHIKPSYELGYIFGFFLGDGSARIHQPRKDKNSFSGCINFYPSITEETYANKLSNFCNMVFGKTCSIKPRNDNVLLTTLYSTQLARFFMEFGKNINKKLPERLMCKDKNYLKGIYDGLVDSDGHREQKRDNLSNTSPFIHELFCVVNYLLNGYFPNQRSNEFQDSRLIKAKNESFISRTLSRPTSRITSQGFEVVKPLELVDLVMKLNVYDIEVDCETHSFIANNAIVHNSGCTTRKVTGIGYPQLSAIIECADAAHGLNGLVCADGGCRHSGDFAKAFGAGADLVMAGGVFAGHEEGGGRVEALNGERLRAFHGMSSQAAMNEHYGGMAEYKASEGRELLIPDKGRVRTTILDILGGLRSACTYIGVDNLKPFSKATTFVRVNRQLNTVFEK